VITRRAGVAGCPVPCRNQALVGRARGGAPGLKLRVQSGRALEGNITLLQEIITGNYYKKLLEGNYYKKLLQAY
jgi:hypothetical protein